MLLDSDVLIDFLRGKEAAEDLLASLPSGESHYCSAITVGEIHSGMRENERKRTTELIEGLEVLPVTKEIAEVAGEFRHRYSTRTSPFHLELDDCIIAATSVVAGIELVTGNRRHYPMPEVRIRQIT